jgi:hypothetical protein
MEVTWLEALTVAEQVVSMKAYTAKDPEYAAFMRKVARVLEEMGRELQ